MLFPSAIRWFGGRRRPMLASGADAFARGHDRGADASRRTLVWVNVAPLRMEKQARHPVLIEFWDVCRPSCLRTLPYLRAWHERYADAGLRVIGVHASGFPAGRDEDRVREAIARLGIAHPVAARPGLPAVAGLRRAGLAVALPVRPAPAAVRGPPRRGRLPRHRARDPGAARDRRAADPARRPDRRRRRADRRPDRRRRRALRGRVRRRRGLGRRSTGPATVTVNGEAPRPRPPRRPPRDPPRPAHRRRAAGRRGRDGRRAGDRVPPRARLSAQAAARSAARHRRRRHTGSHGPVGPPRAVPSSAPCSCGTRTTPDPSPRHRDGGEVSYECSGRRPRSSAIVTSRGGPVSSMRMPRPGR